MALGPGGGPLGGRPTDKNQTNASWFPGRPADAPQPKKGKKLKKGIFGKPLGKKKKDNG